MPFINILKDGTIVDDMGKIDFDKHPLPPEFIQILTKIIFKDEHIEIIDEKSG